MSGATLQPGVAPDVRIKKLEHVARARGGAFRIGNGEPPDEAASKIAKERWRESAPSPKLTSEFPSYFLVANESKAWANEEGRA